MIRAYCYASGLIGFGSKIPKGAIVIARGPAKELRDFIDGVARHGYSTRMVRGRRTKIPGTETLLVPGIPEAPNQAVGIDALEIWLGWIGTHQRPAGVRLVGGRPPKKVPQRTSEAA
jgi:hypothetical protein